MKVRVIKKENKGFALLFSVLISSLILTIGLSILSVSIKELAISIASKQSVHAFYAADSGLECAKYWDIKKGLIPTLIEGRDTGYTGGTIVCGGGLSQALYKQVPSSPYQTTLTPLNMLVSDGTDNANFDVTILKSWHDGTQTEIDTTITSTGHDSLGGDRVERAIVQTY